MSVIIESIKPGDNAGIEAVIKSVLEEHGVNKPGTAYFDASLKDMYTFYTVPASTYFIAKLDGKLIGGAGIYPTEGLPYGTCELVKMYLLPETRGKGYGKALIDTCIEFAKHAGYKSIYLETMNELSNAIGMYQQSGFNLLNAPLGNTGHFACTIRMLKEI